jgi:hypothetical protein
MKTKNKKTLYIVIGIIGGLIFLCLLVAIFTTAVKPSESVIQTAIAETKALEPTITIPSTYTPYPTYTPNIIVVTATNSPTPEFTPTQSLTPTITNTPTETIPPTSTSTITPTVTQTKAPGVGVDIKCGNDFIIKVLTKPQKETYFYGTKPSGEFWLFKIEITNLMGVTHQLHESDFGVSAIYNDQEILFESNWDATFDWVYHNWGGLIYPNDEIGPTLKAKMGIAFDVNPAAEDYKLIWMPRDNMFDSFSDAICRVAIPLE